MRKLATIRTIASIEPIQDADRIMLATMVDIGWQTVVGKDQFSVGDRVVYFEIDSALPIDQRYEFLRKNCYRAFSNPSGELLASCFRIKTIRLRGIISQGLVCKIGDFPELAGLDSYENGTDVTENLGVKNYDEMKEQYGTKPSGDCTGSFPSAYVPKTDEERIQNLSKYFSSNKMAEMEFEVTEKNDGSSMTVIYSPLMRSENPFFVCSRNNEIKYDENTLWAVPLVKDNVMQKLADYYNDTKNEYAFQGEIVGPGMNGNKDLYTELEWHIFKIWDVKNQKFLTPQERKNVCLSIGLKHVHVVSDNMKVFSVLTDLEKMLSFVDGKTSRGNNREGFVFKSLDGKISFKCINNNYLLNNDRD